MKTALCSLTKPPPYTTTVYNSHTQGCCTSQVVTAENCSTEDGLEEMPPQAVMNTHSLSTMRLNSTE